ncbi:exported hypothetical protein [Frankia sp. AiPs1]
MTMRARLYSASRRSTRRDAAGASLSPVSPVSPAASAVVGATAPDDAGAVVGVPVRVMAVVSDNERSVDGDRIPASALLSVSGRNGGTSAITVRLTRGCVTGWWQKTSGS